MAPARSCAPREGPRGPAGPAEISEAENIDMTQRVLARGVVLAGLVVLAVVLAGMSLPSEAQAKKPNILMIFGDDVGRTNISAYSMGVGGSRARA
jgi:hypothetical protein